MATRLAWPSSPSPSTSPRFTLAGGEAAAAAGSSRSLASLAPTGTWLHMTERGMARLVIEIMWNTCSINSLIKFLSPLFLIYDIIFPTALSFFIILLIIRFNSALKYLQNKSEQNRVITASSTAETVVLLDELLLIRASTPHHLFLLRQITVSNIAGYEQNTQQRFYLVTSFNLSNHCLHPFLSSLLSSQQVMNWRQHSCKWGAFKPRCVSCATTNMLPEGRWRNKAQQDTILYDNMF